MQRLLNSFAAAAIGLFTTVASANLVQNGDFSDGLRWWSVQGGDGHATFSGGYVTFKVAFDTFVEIDQQLPTNINDSYYLSFQYLGSATKFDIRWNEVSLWSSAVNSELPTTAAFTINTAGRSPSTLSFFVIGESSGVSLGNVSLAPIPEPSTLALILAGLVLTTQVAGSRARSEA